MSSLPKFLSHRSKTNPDIVEFKLPNLVPGKKSRKIFGLVIAGIFAIFLLYQLFRWIVNYPVFSALDSTKNFTSNEIAKDPTLATINQIIELPNDQNGTYGKIKDNNALGQRKDFFKKARNGDILVIYPDMTVIYDPENHSVVDIAKTNLLQ